MVDTAVTVAEGLVSVGPYIARFISYTWNCETYFNELETELRKLEGQRDRVQHLVEEAIRNGEQIEQLVNDWLGRVHTIIAEVSKVIEENVRGDMKCCMGLCPMLSYQRSSKAVEKTKVVAGLYDEGSFPKEEISFRTIPEETWIPSSKDYMVLESRISTLKKIIDALSNPDVNMVGIYGAGGIGKTTLAREVAAQHAKDKKLFNVVAFAEVAVNPNIEKIQQEIADFLGLKFESEKSDGGRARRLQKRLKQEKVLLVLDNIWDKLDLAKVGIPFGSDHKGCKLLLTARGLDVLSKMNSRSYNFPIDVLDKGEAWSFFEKKTGACIENNDRLRHLAKQVAEACGGFPIAIDTVAVALRDQEEFEWEDALKKLTSPSSSNFEGVTAETYSCMEFSYNRLKEKALKSTFLLCCIMENTRIEYLLAYGMGLGIFEKVETMKDARNEVNTLLRKLKDSSLLLDINNYQFSLHDVVRGVGTSIASRDWNMFRNCTIRELVDKDELKNCFAITLHKIKELPKEFECPELQFIYIKVGNCQFPDNFFVGMPKLKVLHLGESMELYSMPNSIGLLVNLRTLYIDDCELWDIDFIGEIKQLEILRIRGSHHDEIEMIPKKMCNLTGLRLLDLSECYSLRNIPPNVLSTFTRLEELYLPSSIKWKVEGVNILDELKHLTHLTALEISIPDANVLPKGQLLSKKLERYRITFGSSLWSEFYMLRETSRRTVKLNLESSSCSDDVQKFLSVLDTEGFPELENLWVAKSPGFRTVVDCFAHSESCHNHFLFLKWLNLRSVFNLERIHNHQLRAESFQQLTTLEVVECNKLKNIFSFSTYRALPRLQRVYVSSCDNMEEIFAINRREEGINNDEGTDQIEFKELRTLRLNSLPKLTGFCSINGNKDILDTPTPLFNQKVSFPSLEEIKISEMSALEMIWPNQLCKDPQQMFSFQKLSTVKVHHCNSLKYLFPVSIVKSLSELEKLHVHDCEVLEEIVGDDHEEAKVADTFVFPRVTSLKLKCLPRLKFKTLYRLSKTLVMCRFDKFELFASELFDFQENKDWFCNIKSLEVTKCNKLLTIFQSNMLERITRLESLTVRDCDLVEVIFDLQGVDFEKSHSEIETLLRKLVINGLPKLKHIWNKDPQKMFSYQKLSSVEVYNCMSLKYLFPVSIAESLLELQQLYLRRCGVEEIVGDDQGETNVAATFVFPRITSLDLDSLPRLKTFYRGVHTSQWQNLKRLTMCDCDKVELFASELFDFRENNEGQHDNSLQPLFIVEKVTFPSLEEIKISYSNNLKMVWHKRDKESFFNLKQMIVYNCSSLLTIFQFSMPRLLTVGVSCCALVEENFDRQKVNFEELDISWLPKLKHIWKTDPQAKLSFEELPMPKSLTVEYCDSIEEIFDLQKVNFEESHPGAITQQLQELRIDQLPKLKHIWNKDPQAELFFKSLQKVEVYNCQNLKDLFPASIGRSLSQLVKLDVDNCRKLEEIVAKEGEAKAAVRFVFLEVTSIKLMNLPQLRTFYRGVHSSKWKVLKELEVVGCDKIELLASELFSFQENNEEGHLEIPAQSPFFLVEKDSFPNLEKLILGGKAIKIMTLLGQFSEELFCNLKFLEVRGEESVVFPLCILKRFRHLHKLCLKSCSYKEIFSYQKDETHVWIDSKLDTVLKKLESLKVEKCCNLIQLWPSSASFQNLTILMVSDCNGLKNLMTSSTARSLVQLREMEIVDCESMIEVVTKEGDVTEEDEITFNKLRTLILSRLSSLSCFCSENCTFELPSLEELALDSCRKMKFFSSGDVTAPILQRVEGDWGDEKEYKVNGDLNKTIQQIQDDTCDWEEDDSYDLARLFSAN